MMFWDFYTPDALLLSPKRIAKAIRWWLWYTAVMEGNLPFWKLVRFYDRQLMAHLKGWY